MPLCLVKLAREPFFGAKASENHMDIGVSLKLVRPPPAANYLLGFIL